MSYFPEPCINTKNKVKVELILSTYTTKFDFKKVTGVDTPKFAKNADLHSLKPGVDGLDIDKLKTVPIYLSKFSNAVKKIFLRRLYMLNQVAKVNALESGGCVLKTQYNSDKSDLERKLMTLINKYLILKDSLKHVL